MPGLDDLSLPMWPSLSAAHGTARAGYTIRCGKMGSRKKKASLQIDIAFKHLIGIELPQGDAIELLKEQCTDRRSKKNTVSTQNSEIDELIDVFKSQLLSQRGQLPVKSCLSERIFSADI